MAKRTHKNQDEKAPAGVMLRYYQGRRAVYTRGMQYPTFNIDAFVGRPPGPVPVRITERVLFTVDRATYCCEATPSTYMVVLDYDAEWEADVEASVSDELREWWNMALLECRSEDDCYYVHMSRVFTVSAPSTATAGPDVAFKMPGWLRSAAYQGEYPADDEHQAIEDAFEDVLV